ncbi:hypothetical protein Tco_0922812 [Tanacetum coccineum]|uniref:F-box associated domain-containing protein n=1 Tax=Tanacetum coccineum TaxID=301880 RepID=A0ABQ5D071_9ASTR
MSLSKPRENCFGCGFVLWDEERVRLVTSSSGASSTPSYSPGPSTPPSYSPRSSTPQSYSPGSSRNAECSNCKHLMEKITLTQRQQWEMYRHPVQHTLIQLHYFTKFTMTWEYLDLGVVSLLECISYALSVLSKPWCVYIDDDYFGILHGERCVEELTPIMYDPNLSCITCFNIIKSEEGNTTLEAKKGLSYKSCYKCREIFVGGSCNGLLYLSLTSIPWTTPLAVIHPLRKEFHAFPPMRRLDGPHYLREESRGLGFDVSTNTFKMDSSWREIPPVPPHPTSGDGIFAHGCLYWNEKFTLIYPPKRRCGYSVINYQLVDQQGEVGYAYFYSDYIIEVWVLKQNQWAKHCQFIKPPLRPIIHITVLGRWNKDGDILIEIGVKKLFVYSLKSRVLDEVNIVGQEYDNAYMYMYPASSMFSIRGINKTAHSIKAD